MLPVLCCRRTRAEHISARRKRLRGRQDRHLLARRTIEDYLSASEATGPVVEDPAELKRPWLYGFYVRACEEALPEGVSLGEGE